MLKSLLQTLFVRQKIQLGDGGKIVDKDDNTLVDVNGVTVADVVTTPLTGFVSGAGTVAAADSIVAGISKLDGNVALKAPLASPTFTGAALFGSGTVSAPAIQVGSADTGLYQLSAVQTGFSQDGALVAIMDASGMTADSFRNRVNYGTTPVGTVSITEYGDSRDMTTLLLLTDFIIGVPGEAAAAKGFGNIVYAFPAGAHLEVGSYFSLALKAAGTAVAADIGLGSVVAVGAVAVLDSVGTWEERLTGQTITTDPAGGTAVAAIGIPGGAVGTGISANLAASVKNIFLNAAGTWNVNNTGNLTATGTITLKWTRLS